MRPDEWEKALLAATERVRRKLAPLSAKADRGKTVGVGAAGDMTLFADRVAEEELLGTLLRGKARVLSEEAGFAGDPGSQAIAIVDPLDGSSNFSRGVPFYCTSVAIAEGSSAADITVGVVRDLVSGDAFSAVRGHGAKKNGKRISASGAEELTEAVVGIDLSRGGVSMAARLAPLVGKVKRQVHFGANALELCFVADGRTDAFVDVRGRIRVTDLAAAYLIASEAGAVITGTDGGPISLAFDFDQRVSFVASASQPLHKQILELLGEPGGA